MRTHTDIYRPTRATNTPRHPQIHLTFSIHLKSCPHVDTHAHRFLSYWDVQICKNAHISLPLPQINAETSMVAHQYTYIRTDSWILTHRDTFSSSGLKTPPGTKMHRLVFILPQIYVHPESISTATLTHVDTYTFTDTPANDSLRHQLIHIS